jgi:ABC-type arginine transport system permease subunit
MHNNIGKGYKHSVKEAPDILVVFLVYFQTHTKTQAPKQTHVRMQAKYTQTSRQNHCHLTEIYCSFAALSYLTLLKSDVEKSAVNIRMIS